MSNNTNLTNLACYNNNLTSLDLSNNLNLTLLYCNNNQISSLDVSQNTLLTHLKCNINQLSSLNVRNGNNSTLGTFDASTNPLLYCIEVDNSFEGPQSLISQNDAILQKPIQEQAYIVLGLKILTQNIMKIVVPLQFQILTSSNI